MVDYKVPVAPGMVVLDAVHAVQAMHSPDLAVRWNCKAGKCGSCGGEVNGKPRLMCMDRMDKYPAGEPITIRPMKTFPVMKDLACDVSWNYKVNKKIPPFKMKKTDGEPRFSQEEADRVQEFRKCIECFLCQNVCHVLREHDKQAEFAGPRFFVRVAGLEMHPLDDGRPAGAAEGRDGPRLLQHHEVLHGGLPGAHPDHRQRDHPAQGARGGSVLRSGEEAAADCVSEAGLTPGRA